MASCLSSSLHATSEGDRSALESATPRSSFRHRRNHLRAILTPTEVEDIHTLHAACTPIDTSDELQLVLARVGLHLLDDDVNALATKYGFENGTALSLDSLVRIMNELKHQHLENRVDDVQEAFSALAGDEAAIDAFQIRQVASMFRLTIDVERLLREADEDGSGLIEFDEFEKLIDAIDDDDDENGFDEPCSDSSPSSSPPLPAGAQPPSATQLIDDSLRLEGALPPIRKSMSRSAGRIVVGKGQSRRGASLAAASRIRLLSRHPTLASVAEGREALATQLVELLAREADSSSASCSDGEEATGARRSRSRTPASFATERHDTLERSSRRSALHPKKKKNQLPLKRNRGRLRHCGASPQGTTVARAAPDDKSRSRTQSQIVLVSEATGTAKVLKLPPLTLPNSRSPARLYAERAPQWTVNFADFIGS